VTRVEVDRFLDPNAPKWARFDAQLGYLPHPSDVPDNIDGALSYYRYGRRGERRVVNYPEATSRIHTYGDSFTQCHQVSDGETWQEALAAHFGEPILNFGVGGFGVYHAVQRLKRLEFSDDGASVVLLNIYLDDHFRSLDSYRRIRVGSWLSEYDRGLKTSMFHANPWEHVRIDASSSELVTRPNACPTPESLYQLTDLDFLVETFGEDLIVRKIAADITGDYSFADDYADLTETLGIDHDLPARHRAEQLWTRSAYRATKSILADLAQQMRASNKTLVVLLTYPSEEVAAFLRTGRRPDTPVLQDLAELGLPVIDALELHANDYAAYALSPREYVGRLYNGHYSPLGNTTYAFMIKDRLLHALDEQPPSYADAGRSFASLAGRLA
jgi:hypothetical protein